MNIEQVIVFNEIIKQGTMRSAAESLHKSQPALSIALKNLEEELGFTLIDRNFYRPLLTEKGRLFLDKSQELLESVQSLKNYALELKGCEETRLRIAIDSAAPFEALIPRIQQCASDHPSLELEFSFGVLTQCVDQLINNQADLAIAPLFQPNNEINSEALLKLKLVCALHKKHCLNDEVPALSKLRSLPNIIVGSGNKDSPLSVPGLKGGKKFHVSNHAVKEQLILAGVGWGRISDERMKESSYADRLNIISHPQLAPIDVDIEIMWNHSKSLGPIGKKIKNDLILFCRGTHKS